MPDEHCILFRCPGFCTYSLSALPRARVLSLGVRSSIANSLRAPAQLRAFICAQDPLGRTRRAANAGDRSLY